MPSVLLVWVAFLRDTASERARDVHAFQEAALSEIHRHTGFDVDDTDRSTSAIKFQFLFSLALVDRTRLRLHLCHQPTMRKR